MTELWTYNTRRKNIMLGKNKVKLNAAKTYSYNIILVLDKEHINA
jgi:hypothetical protein